MCETAGVRKQVRIIVHHRREGIRRISGLSLLDISWTDGSHVVAAWCEEPGVEVIVVWGSERSRRVLERLN